MDLWRDRVKPKKGRPATGQGETKYIPGNRLEIVEKILTASPQSLIEVEKILDNANYET